MRAEVTQQFRGTINGVIIPTESIYYSMKYILDIFEKRFGEDSYTDSFVEDMYDTIMSVYYKYDGITIPVIKESFVDCIQSANKFSNIEFKVNNSTWRLDWFNENISMGIYLTSEKSDKNVEEYKAIA